MHYRKLNGSKRQHECLLLVPLLPAVAAAIFIVSRSSNICYFSNHQQFFGCFVWWLVAKPQQRALCIYHLCLCSMIMHFSDLSSFPPFFHSHTCALNRTWTLHKQQSIFFSHTCTDIRTPSTFTFRFRFRFHLLFDARSHIHSAIVPHTFPFFVAPKRNNNTLFYINLKF